MMHTHRYAQIFTPLALIAILAAGAVVRFWHLGQPSLWMDELWSIESSSGHGSMHEQLPVGEIQTGDIELTSLQNAPPWWTTWSAQADPRHPPLYRLVLRLWMDVFGTTATATRSLSVVASLLAILLLFDAVRLTHGPQAALMAAALMALSGSQIEAAQDTRSYALLICLGVACCDLLIRIEKRGPTLLRAAVLAVLIAAAALTHYFALGALAGLGIYAAIQLRGRARHYALGAFLAAALLAAALWLGTFLHHVRGLTGFQPEFLIDPSPDPHWQLCLRLIGLPCKFLGGERFAGALTPQAYVAVAVLVFVIPLLSLRRNATLLWFLWMIGTLGLVGGMDFERHSCFTAYQRYTLLASPGMFALLATLDWPRIRAVRIGIPLGLIVVMCLACAVRVHDGPETHEEWRALAQSLDQKAGPNDLLVFFNNEPGIAPGTWYMGFHHYAPDSHRPWLILTTRPTPDLVRQLRVHRTIWLVGKYPDQIGSRLLPGWWPVATVTNWTSAGAFVPMVLIDHSVQNTTRP